MSLRKYDFPVQLMIASYEQSNAPLDQHYTSIVHI